MAQASIFDGFTNLYALSKTLRFELKPVGKTLEHMRDHLRYDTHLQTFLADQEIEDAYQTLKPVLDTLHENFINQSLESKSAKQITFESYFDAYKNKENLEQIEKNLRSKLDQLYEDTAQYWKSEFAKNSKDKSLFKDKGHKILTEQGILKYIQKNLEKLSGDISSEDITSSLRTFEGFFTYFGGFNQNRENYYETKKEADTSVASRIVHTNLPKYCDNSIIFDDMQQEYEKLFAYLRSAGKELVDKEKRPLWSIPQNIFDIKNFSKYMSQTGIEAYNREIGNANFLINLNNQTKSSESGYKKLPLLKSLYKQIGCGKRSSIIFTITHDRKSDIDQDKTSNRQEFHSVEEVLNLARGAGVKYFQGTSKDGIVNTIPEFTAYLTNRSDYKGIYWSKAALNTISNSYFANWFGLVDKLKVAKVFDKPQKDSEEIAKIPEAVELEGLFKVLDEDKDWRKNMFKDSVLENSAKKKLFETVKSASEALLMFLLSDISDNAADFLNQAGSILDLKNYQTESDKKLIKVWMDHALAVTQILKYFRVKESKVKGNPVDGGLDQALKNLLDSDDAPWFRWYDALRNYLTRKPGDDVKKNKLKLNFENSTLAGGWDINKESENFCIILQDPKGNKFLAIISKQNISKGYNKLFVKSAINSLFKPGKGEPWQKMEYKLLPGPNKMLPKCLLPKSNRSKYGATRDLLSMYDSGSFKKGSHDFLVRDTHQLIDFYKSALAKYEDWQCFKFSFRHTDQYQDISQFYLDVEKQGYLLSFTDVNYSLVEEWVKNGQLYLFEIRNQDSNDKKKPNHKDNLHTMFWKTVFSTLNNRPKLNGNAEIFYRKSLSPEKLEKISDRNGKKIIKNYRFSKDKFLFHVPITLNFCLKDSHLNDKVNEKLSASSQVKFLGIDRGEKHLAYYSVVDLNGTIIEQASLNIPFPKKENQVDYNKLLTQRAGERDTARKDWQTIGTIKDLKDGYISQVVRKIADLALKYNAFIVLEDLNTGFKRGRQKIEKSVYQKFELALAKKLNYLVDKNAKPGDPGSVTRALQLTPPVSNYGDIEKRKQVGIMLYTRANYTSQTDPVTGWRKSIYIKKGSEETIKNDIYGVFSDIGFEGKDYFFTYTDKNTGKEWRLFSGKNGASLDRFRGRRSKEKNEWTIEKINVVEILDVVFVGFDKGRSLLSQIFDEDIELAKYKNVTAWESIRFVIDLIQQIRNTGLSEKDSDFIQSPVRDGSGNHFDSRNANSGQPDSGDANGAYNIARKGIVMLEHIKRGYSLYIRDEEWDFWLTGKDVWEKWIVNNAEILKNKFSKGKVKTDKYEKSFSDGLI